MRTHLEQRHVIVLSECPALFVGAVQDLVGHLPFPPGHRLRRVCTVTLDQLGIAVDGEEELVQQVFAHTSAPFGYHVKYASMVWNRSRVSTWSALTPSPATPIINMKSMKPWVALPGVCKLSRVTSARHPLRSPVAIHATALRSNSGAGPCGPN